MCYNDSLAVGEGSRGAIIFAWLRSHWMLAAGEQRVCERAAGGVSFVHFHPKHKNSRAPSGGAEVIKVCARDESARALVQSVAPNMRGRPSRGPERCVPAECLREWGNTYSVSPHPSHISPTPHRPQSDLLWSRLDWDPWDSEWNSADCHSLWAAGSCAGLARPHEPLATPLALFGPRAFLPTHPDCVQEAARGP